MTDLSALVPPGAALPRSHSSKSYCSVPLASTSHGNEIPSCLHRRCRGCIRHTWGCYASELRGHAFNLKPNENDGNCRFRVCELPFPSSPRICFARRPSSRPLLGSVCRDLILFEGKQPKSHLQGTLGVQGGHEHAQAGLEVRGGGLAFPDLAVWRRLGCLAGCVPVPGSR